VAELRAGLALRAGIAATLAVAVVLGVSACTPSDGKAETPAESTSWIPLDENGAGTLTGTGVTTEGTGLYAGSPRMTGWSEATTDGVAPQPSAPEYAEVAVVKDRTDSEIAYSTVVVMLYGDDTEFVMPNTPEPDSSREAFESSGRWDGYRIDYHEADGNLIVDRIEFGRSH